MPAGAGNPDGQVDPSLRLFGDRRFKVRYPSPFFDISQQYIPPTVKELFKWVYFYATNNSFVGPALNKIARYPVTDLILEDTNPNLVRKWKTVLNGVFHIKTFLMEANMDLVTYGNAFVTIFYPFSRFLSCTSCREKHPWKTVKKKIQNLKIYITCKKCGANVEAKINDVPFSSLENMRLIRINPEFIDIKYNDATGRHTYLYSIPDKLKRQIMAGDPDILEDTPLIYLEAIRSRKKIKLSTQNLYHLKRPSLAGKDMGWGLPMMVPALKDLYYFYQLRRAQESIAHEHTVPFDIIFPQANGRFDPYVHSEISNWKREIESQLAKRRRDPNYKAVLPFPVGFERIGGDGKALMLTPELDFLAKTIVGSMGIPQEFIYGGTMTWTASSVSLRTLENEFLHHRTQLLHFVIWLCERVKLYVNIPTCSSVRFSDFKMADDMQKLQMMINMAQSKKLSWENVLKEMGKDPKIENEKIELENQFEARLNEHQMIAQAEAQSKAQKVQQRYTYEQQLESSGGPPTPEAQQQEEMVQAMAQRLMQQPPEIQQQAIQRLQQQNPEFAQRVQDALTQSAALVEQQQQQQMQQQQQEQAAQPQAPKKPKAQKPAQPKGVNVNINMKPMPEQRAPRRKGAM